jgi:hypothetical protein
LDAVAKNLMRLFSQGVNWPVNSRGMMKQNFQKASFKREKSHELIAFPEINRLANIGLT